MYKLAVGIFLAFATGSAALAGTSFPLDRQMTAAALGFDGPTRNSLDGVIRDVIFIGGTTKYFIGLDTGHTISLTALTTEAEGRAGLGERVQVTWPVESTVVLAAGEGAPA